MNFKDQLDGYSHMNVTAEQALQALDELRNYDPEDILRPFRRDAGGNAEEILRAYLTAKADEEAKRPARRGFSWR